MRQRQREEQRGEREREKRRERKRGNGQTRALTSQETVDRWKDASLPAARLPRAPLGHRRRNQPPTSTLGHPLLPQPNSHSPPSCRKHSANTPSGGVALDKDQDYRCNRATGQPTPTSSGSAPASAHSAAHSHHRSECMSRSDSTSATAQSPC